MKYAVNGKFLSQRTTGVQRFVRELLNELDKIICPGEICIICSNDALDIPNYSNLNIIKIGEKADMIWLQITFPFYCIKHNLISVNLCGSGPLLRPDIVCMHDVGFIHYPNFVSKSFYQWGKLQIFNSIHRAKGLITVSEFSKKDIERLYPKTRGKFVVIPNSWEHMAKIKADDSFFEKHFNIKRNEYFFSMSSLSPNKNLNWIIQTANNSKDSIFVVAGNLNKKVFGNQNIKLPENVILIGYVTDEEAKALLQHCKAFIFPTFFEGFGIPPLEALACGAKNIIVSNTECMHEVYGNSAYYIDPQTPSRDIDEILKKEVDSPEAVLKRYSWQRSAEKLKAYLNL